MDRVLFLHSNGGILSEYPQLRSEEPLPVAPYVEQVNIPAVSVDTQALYGDTPSLAVLTFSSGGALTFFCDSVAGGNDSSGDGSFDAPWRSLDAASKFLSRHAPLLKKAAPYTQLKIKGTVDYVSSAWEPFGPFNDRSPTGAAQLILAGWGGKTDLAGHPSACFAAGYLFGLRVNPGNSALIACSGCDVVRDHASESLAVDCRFVSGAYVSCACNCSADATDQGVYARICHGGSYRTQLTVVYAYGTTVSVNVAGSQYGSVGMIVSSAAVGLAVTVVNTGDSRTKAVGVYARGYLGDCTVTASAAATLTAAGQNSGTAAIAMFGSFGNGAVVSGGNWTAKATAHTVTNEPAGGEPGTKYNADAIASAVGFPTYVTFNGVATTFTASAGAVLNAPDGEAYEYERISNGGASSWTSRARCYSGGVMYSSWSSSGPR